MQLRVSTATLLYLSAAHVADVVVRTGVGGDVGVAAGGGVDVTGVHNREEGGAATMLPLPYTPGSALVHVVGRVVSRRRIARRLVFVHVVPAVSPSGVRARGGDGVSPSGVDRRGGGGANGPGWNDTSSISSIHSTNGGVGLISEGHDGNGQEGNAHREAGNTHREAGNTHRDTSDDDNIIHNSNHHHNNSTYNSNHDNNNGNNNGNNSSTQNSNSNSNDMPTPPNAWSTWTSPLTGQPCEVQLIMGKTLVNALGEDDADEAMHKVKVGSIMRVVARPAAQRQRQRGGRG